MVMFINLKCQIQKIIFKMQSKQLSLAQAHQAVWQLTQNKFNYPLRMLCNDNKHAISKLSKKDLLLKLNSAVKYIDNYNVKQKAFIKKHYGK